MPDSGNSGNQGSSNSQSAGSTNWSGLANLGGLGLQSAALALGNDMETLSRADQRWLADFQWKQSLRNEDFQHELATHGIRLRVADAEAAGLHPLVGAGINPASGSFGMPISGGGGGESSGSKFASKLADMGQNISRAAASTMTQDERLVLHSNAMKAQSEADLARSQAALARAQTAELGKKPPIPNAHTLIRNDDGSFSTINNPDLAGAIMSDPLGMWGTAVHNTVSDIKHSPKWDIPGNFISGYRYRTDEDARGWDRRRYPPKR